MKDARLTTIVERINHALEYVIAPEVESPIVRGQLFAVVEMLNQLPGKYEYRHDLMVQDIEVGKEMLATILDALERAGIEMPAEISEETRHVDWAGMSGDQLREERGRVEGAVTEALDLLDAHRSAIPEAEKVEKTVLGQLGRNILRDMMLFRTPRFETISQRLQEE